MCPAHTCLLHWMCVTTHKPHTSLNSGFSTVYFPLLTHTLFSAYYVQNLQWTFPPS
jgi:hypothetical protein